MRDFPMFTTEYGVASLVLREVPYRGEAYITLRDSREPEKLLKECADFCRACGAEKIYAKAHAASEAYPLHAAVYEMRGEAKVDRETLESLFPVTEETVSRWRSICNERMRDIDCSATQTAADEKEIIESGGAYFVHHEGELLGIGWLDDTELLLICAVQPGAGRRVMNTLLSLVEGAQVRLEVASTNQRAIRFYEKLGFIKTGERVRWHRVL